MAPARDAAPCPSPLLGPSATGPLFVAPDIGFGWPLVGTFAVGDANDDTDEEIDDEDGDAVDDDVVELGSDDCDEDEDDDDGAADDDDDADGAGCGFELC